MAIPGTEIDFKIQKEDWNIYHLDDGTIIKMRVILTKMNSSPPPFGAGLSSLEKGKETQRGFNTSFNNIMTVQKSPISLMGVPETEPFNMEEAEKVDVGFTAFQEYWNEYEIIEGGLPQGFKIRVKLVVSSIQRVVKHHDQFGYPIYMIISTNAVIPVVPPSRKK